MNQKRRKFKKGVSSYIDDLWNRIGEKLKSRGIGQREIDKTI